MKKEATSYRLTPDAKEIIKSLVVRLGLNETSIVELAIRELEERTRQMLQAKQHVIGIEFESYAERKNALPQLKKLFENVSSHESNKHGIHVICSQPIGKSYDEAFEVCKAKFFECGWINPDSL